MFNPKVKDFLEAEPDKKMLSLAWSLWWRLFLVIYASAFLIGIIVALSDL